VKSKDNTLTYLFVTVLTVMIWLWAAMVTNVDTVVSVELNFSPPEGSSSTISPSTTTVTVTFRGPQRGLSAAREACSGGLTITVPTTSGTPELDLALSIAELDAIRGTGVVISEIDPKSVSLHVKTMVSVEAVVVAVLNGVEVTGDITVDPATVILLIPSTVRDTLPEVITVTASINATELGLLQPGRVHTMDAGIHLPAPLDLPDVRVEPNRVEVSFTIQKKTAKTTLPHIRVLLAGPAEDYSGYSIELPRKLIPNVTVNADAKLIAEIENGNATVFAIVRLASRDLEQGIDHKGVTAFLAITADGRGQEVTATVEDQGLLNIELDITPVTTVQ